MKRKFKVLLGILLLFVVTSGVVLLSLPHPSQEESFTREHSVKRPKPPPKPHPPSRVHPIKQVEHTEEDDTYTSSDEEFEINNKFLEKYSDIFHSEDRRGKLPALKEFERISVNSPYLRDTLHMRVIVELESVLHDDVPSEPDSFYQEMLDMLPQGDRSEIYLKFQEEGRLNVYGEKRERFERYFREAK